MIPTLLTVLRIPSYFLICLIFFTFPSQAKYLWRICVCVCLSLCVRAYLGNYTSKVHHCTSLPAVQRKLSLAICIYRQVPANYRTTATAQNSGIMMVLGARGRSNKCTPRPVFIPNIFWGGIVPPKLTTATLKRLPNRALDLFWQGNKLKYITQTFF